MAAERSTPLTMSTTANAATVTAVSASISTPVRSAVRTVAFSSTPASVICGSTLAPCTPITWARGSSSGTFLVAAIPAMRATANTSPLGTRPSRKAATTCGEQVTKASALALRTVGVLAVTSTMRAAPAESRWVNSSFSFPLAGLLGARPWLLGATASQLSVLAGAVVQEGLPGVVQEGPLGVLGATSVGAPGPSCQAGVRLSKRKGWPTSTASISPGTTAKACAKCSEPIRCEPEPRRCEGVATA